MAGVLLGRTNARFPAVWLRPEVPESSSTLDALIEAVAGARTVVDVSTSPALWGRHLPDTALLAGARIPEGPFASGARSAYHEMHDAIIGALFSTGRQPLDFFCLAVASMPEKLRLEAAIEALHEARTDGLVRYLAIEAASSEAAVLKAWQEHDAFELLVTPPFQSDSQLRGMAAERRVGIAIRGAAAAQGHVRIASVRSRADVEVAMREAVAP